MSTVEKPPLPSRKPTLATGSRDDALLQVLIIYFSFNNTVDPDWTPDPDLQPTSRRERRIARTAAASERDRRAHAEPLGD